MIIIGQQKKQTSLDLSYGFKAFMIEAEAGDFATHAPLGWTRNNPAIDLAVYNNQTVIIVPDDDANLYNLTQPLTFQDIQNLHLYNGVFGGRVALDITDGTNGAFTSIETQQATSIVNADGSQVFATTAARRITGKFTHDGTHVVISSAGVSNITLNGVDTVNVINWNGEAVTNTVPKVAPGEFFDYEVHVQNGLDQRMYLYINKILVGNPEFNANTGGKGGNRLQYTSGASSGVNRITYIRKFGATINTTDSEMVLTKADLEANTSMNLLIPNGTRNYSIALDKGLNLDVGYTLNILTQTIGKISWSSPNGEGLAATIEGFASGQITVTGLQEIKKTNILSGGAQFVGEVEILGDFTLSTGLISGGEISINAGDTTLIDITAGSGQIVDSTTDPDNPLLTPIIWTAKTGYDLTTLPATGDAVAIYLSLDSAGNIIESSALPMPEQRRNTIDFGIVGRLDDGTLIFAYSTPTNVVHNPTSQVQDFMQAWGAFNIYGNRIQPNTLGFGADLKIKKTAGTVFRNGVNFHQNGKDPNINELPEKAPALFGYKLGISAVDISFDSTEIDPNHYDDGTSVLATVPNNKWTIQYVTVFATGDIETLYGQEIFDTETQAIDHLSRIDIIIPEDSRNAIPLAYVILQQSDIALYPTRFYNINKFR